VFQPTIPTAPLPLQTKTANGHSCRV